VGTSGLDIAAHITTTIPTGCNLDVHGDLQTETFPAQQPQHREGTGLTCLETLRISYCPQFVLPHNMNSLTSLRQLDVWQSRNNENILDGIEGIPSLQSLSLSRFPSLTSLPDWLGAMTSLQRLKIDGFPKLSSLPDNFQQLTNLMELSIVDCPMSEKRCKRGIGEDWHKIDHIPELDLHKREPTICGNLIG